MNKVRFPVWESAELFRAERPVLARFLLGI